MHFIKRGIYGFLTGVDILKMLPQRTRTTINFATAPHSFTKSTCTHSPSCNLYPLWSCVGSFQCYDDDDDDYNKFSLHWKWLFLSGTRSSRRFTDSLILISTITFGVVQKEAPFTFNPDIHTMSIDISWLLFAVANLRFDILYWWKK